MMKLEYLKTAFYLILTLLFVAVCGVLSFQRLLVLAAGCHQSVIFELFCGTYEFLTINPWVYVAVYGAIYVYLCVPLVRKHFN